MSLSQQDAAAALHDIEETQRRSAKLRGYTRGSPHLILWGVLWAIGYGLTDLWPPYAGFIWAAVVPIGIIADFVVVRSGRGIERAAVWRFGAVAITLFAFFCAVFFVMAPVSGRQVGAFFPLFVAAVYCIGGVWLGVRYALAGIVIAALTLGGFVFLGQHFSLWMAGVGGGALILAGLWLRRV